MVLPQKDCTVLEGVLSHLGAEGYDGFGKALEMIINAAMLFGSSIYKLSATSAQRSVRAMRMVTSQRGLKPA